MAGTMFHSPRWSSTAYVRPARPGRRGYNEDQVDDFLDRVQATLPARTR